MRNFKQFLFERLNNNKVSFTIDLMYEDGMIDEDFIEEIELGLVESVKGYKGKVLKDDFTLVLIYEDLTDQQIGQKNLEKVVNTVQRYEKQQIKFFNNGKNSRDKIKDGAEYDTYVQSQGYPPTLLEWHDIYITMKPGESLSGIDKMIGLCETLVFHDCRNVTGGLLSLLRIKDAYSIALYTGGTMGSKWIPIVQKHLKGDKDIIDCKEELIAAGFRDLAKL